MRSSAGMHAGHDHERVTRSCGNIRSRPPPRLSKVMDDNLCRCGAHNRIIQAIQAAAKEMHGGH